MLSEIKLWDGTKFLASDYPSESALEQAAADYYAQHPYVPPVVTESPQVQPTPTVQSVLAEGYADQTTGIRLRCDDEARNKFTGQVVLVREYLESGEITAETPIEFWDYNGESHFLPAAQYRALLRRYGAYIQYVEGQF